MITPIKLKQWGVTVSDMAIDDYEKVSHIGCNIFATNVCVKDERINPILLGARREFIPEKAEKTGLCLYCARSITQERVSLRLNFSAKKWCTVIDERTDNKACLSEIDRHKFIVSPDGLGFDCCKTWEALYCGSYPIVKRRYFTEHFAKELPIVVVDEWEEVTEELLEKTYIEFKDKDWNWDLLTEQYWINKIKGDNYEHDRH